MKVTQVAVIALVWLIVSFGLSRCDDQEDNLEDSKSPNQDFDDYSSFTSSISKTFNDEDDGDSFVRKNRPYPIDLRQLPGLPTNVQPLPGVLPFDLFQITVTIPPTGLELLNPQGSDVLSLLDGTLGLSPDSFISSA